MKLLLVWSVETNESAVGIVSRSVNPSSVGNPSVMDLSRLIAGF